MRRISLSRETIIKQTTGTNKKRATLTHSCFDNRSLRLCSDSDISEKI